jgi:RND family efflux transporter MFP subunit
MFAPKSLALPRLGAWQRLAGVLLILPLAACQLAGPTESPQPRLAVDASTPVANRAPAKPAGAASDVTYTVKRGTLRDSVTVNGRVQPALSAQVAVPVAGTISSVYVRAGEAMKNGDPLVDLTVNEGTLDTARTRARLADLEYETQQARVDDLKRGAGADQLSAARTAVARGQADFQRAQIVHQQAQAEIDAVPSLKDAADRAAQLAQIGLQRANDELSAATAAVQRVEALQQTSTQSIAQTQSEIADATAAEALRAAAATRAAQRRVDLAASKLEDAQAQPNSSRVQLEMAKQQAQVNLFSRAVHDAEVEVDRPDATKDPTGVIAANAVYQVRIGNRQLAQEQTTLDQLKASLDAAKQADDRAIRQARVDLDQAKDELAQAQDEEQRAGQNHQRLKAGGLVTLEPLTLQSQLDLPAAQARVRAAQTTIDEATVRLDQAHAAQGSAALAGNEGSDLYFKLKLTEAEAKSAQIALDEAQASLARLQQGPAVGQLEREQARAAILREEADAAHRAIQPLITVGAPFDSSVLSVGVRVGQAVDAHTVVARVAGQGAMSVVVDASEGDVGRLSTNQKVAVTFPGLGDGSTIDGTVIEISGAASQSTTSDNKITYPITVQLASTPPGLKLGMSAAVNVDLRAAKDVLFVPGNAIRNEDGHTLVTSVQSNGQLTDTPVKVGESFGANVEVLSGLREGDLVTATGPTVAAIRKP